MSAPPLVSIVMPTYNRLRFLPSSVQSIREQTLQGWELIIADDGSDEPTHRYLASLQLDDRVRVIELEHSGNPGKARNAAITLARAPLIAFMDSDDLWMPTKLERQIALLRDERKCGWSYTAFVVVDAEGAPLPSERARAWTPYRGQIFDAVVRGHAAIRTPTVVVRADVVRDAGGFDETIDCGEDYDLWARLALRSRACVVDEPLVQVRRHRAIDASKIGLGYAGRERSLCKLARWTQGPQHALVSAELGRNALAHAAALASHGERRRALATLARSVRVGWNHPRWWYGAVTAAVRITLAAPLRL